MSIEIRPGRESDVKQAYVLMNESKTTLPYLGGFTSSDQILGMVTKGNEKSVTTVVAVDGDELLGISTISPKDTHLEMGLVAVQPDRRREGLGTAMYRLHTARALLEGKLFLLDQVLHFNDLMPPFLEKNGFNFTVELRQKIRNFSSLKYYRKDLLKDDVQDILGGTDYEYVLEHREQYAHNMIKMMDLLREAGREQDAYKLEVNREEVFGYCDVRSA